MNSLERILTAARRGQPEVVPVAPYLGNHGARVAGVPIDQYCRSGQLMAEAQIRAWERYQQDVVVAQSDNYYIAEGFGVTVEHHPDSTPTVKTPAVSSLNDIYRLKVPNPQTDGRMPVYLEAIRRLAEKMSGQVAIRAPGTGPFSLAAHLMGLELFLIELAMADKNPGGNAEAALRHLLGLTSDALIAFGKACLDAGANIVQAGDSLASMDMISPRMYECWAWPYERKVFQALTACTANKPACTLLHICGNMTPVLELMAATGAQVLELDAKVDLAVAKAKVGHQVCLMGNLHPTAILLDGTVAEVAQAASEAIAKAGMAGGFILGSGCEVPAAAPPENLMAMIAVARNIPSTTL
jgi:uroporphyrinogen decarboxylase